MIQITRLIATPNFVDITIEGSREEVDVGMPVYFDGVARSITTGPDKPVQITFRITKDQAPEKLSIKALVYGLLEFYPFKEDG